MANSKVIAAVRSREELLKTISTKVKIVFHLSPDILTLKEDVTLVHQADKKLFIHIDLADGIGKDRSGVQFVKMMGVDGIITTRSNIIKYAREFEVVALQRFFIIDSKSISTTVETLNSSKANMIEIMPGNNPKAVKRLREKINVPIIAGGLIETKEEALEILKSGATAVSTGACELWQI